MLKKLLVEWLFFLAYFLWECSVMKNYFFILVGMIICACATTSRLTDEKLPPIRICADLATIYDADSEFDIAELDNFDKLSYSTTYTMIHTQTDSIERDTIRLSFARSAKRVVKNVFPTIALLDEKPLQSKDYVDIMKATTLAKRLGRNSDAIEELLIPNPKYTKQLFIEVRTYVKDQEFTNSIRTYVFHTKNKEILYYDAVSYRCDLRDEIMFIKTLYYSLEKLKKSID